MTGFEPGSPGIGSDRAVHCATTTHCPNHQIVDWFVAREREEEVFISWLEGEGLWRRVVVVCLFVDDEDEAKHDHL